jgi:hypothetical protein
MSRTPLKQGKTGTKSINKALADLVAAEAATDKTAMTAQEAQTGTATTARNITAKVLADEVDRRITAAVPATASAAELETGTEEGIRKVSPKLLADEIDRRGDAAYQPLTGNTFNVAGVPAAADNVGRVIYVTDGSAGNPCAAISDGTNWKVLALGATIADS